MEQDGTQIIKRIGVSRVEPYRGFEFAARLLPLVLCDECQGKLEMQLGDVLCLGDQPAKSISASAGRAWYS